MSLDITQQITPDSVITGQTLEKYNALPRSPGHLLLEVISTLPYYAAIALQNRLPIEEDEQAEAWERYRERIAIMVEGKDNPTEAQMVRALTNALTPVDYPTTERHIRQAISSKKLEEKNPMEQKSTEQNQMQPKAAETTERIVLKRYDDDSEDYEESDKAGRLQTEFMAKVYSDKRLAPGAAMRVVEALAARNKKKRSEADSNV